MPSFFEYLSLLSQLISFIYRPASSSSPPTPTTVSKFPNYHRSIMPVDVTSLLQETLDELEKLFNPVPPGAQSSSQPQPPARPELCSPQPQQRLGYLTSNPAIATSLPYLSKLFPGVKEATITSVIRHELPPSDLYKLDPRYLDEGETKTAELGDGITYEFPNVNSSLKEYKTLSSIIVPLSTYFSILIAHYNQFAGNAASLAVQMFSYTADLASIANEHRWHLIVAFHMAFFARRQREMIGGDYGGWGRFIVEFMEGMKF